MKKTKQKEIKEKKIVNTETKLYISGKSVRIVHEGTLYLTNIEFLESKIKDDVFHLPLGKMEKDGINNEVQVWLTKKGKGLYFSPKKGVVLISSISGLEKVLSGELDNINFGVFE